MFKSGNHSLKLSEVRKYKHLYINIEPCKIKMSFNLRSPNLTNNGEEAGKGPGIRGNWASYDINLTTLF